MMTKTLKERMLKKLSSQDTEIDNFLKNEKLLKEQIKYAHNENLTTEANFR